MEIRTTVSAYSVAFTINQVHTKKLKPVLNVLMNKFLVLDFPLKFIIFTIWH